MTRSRRTDHTTADGVVSSDCRQRVVQAGALLFRQRLFQVGVSQLVFSGVMPHSTMSAGRCSLRPSLYRAAGVEPHDSRALEFGGSPGLRSSLSSFSLVSNEIRSMFHSTGGA